MISSGSKAIPSLDLSNSLIPAVGQLAEDWKVLCLFYQENALRQSKNQGFQLNPQAGKVSKLCLSKNTISVPFLPVMPGQDSSQLDLSFCELNAICPEDEQCLKALYEECYTYE